MSYLFYSFICVATFEAEGSLCTGYSVEFTLCAVDKSLDVFLCLAMCDWRQLGDHICLMQAGVIPCPWIMTTPSGAVLTSLSISTDVALQQWLNACAGAFDGWNAFKIDFPVLYGKPLGISSILSVSVQASSVTIDEGTDLKELFSVNLPSTATCLLCLLGCSQLKQDLMGKLLEARPFSRESEGRSTLSKANQSKPIR